MFTRRTSLTSGIHQICDSLTIREVWQPSFRIFLPIQEHYILKLSQILLRNVLVHLLAWLLAATNIFFVGKVLEAINISKVTSFNCLLKHLLHVRICVMREGIFEELGRNLQAYERWL